MADYFKEKALPQLLEYGIEFFPLQHKEQGGVTKAHIHPAIELIYVTAGRYDIGIDNEIFAAEYL